MSQKNTNSARRAAKWTTTVLVAASLLAWCSSTGGLWPRPAADSAASATAISTGIKTEKGNIAWAAGDPEDGALTTLCEWVRSEVDGDCGIVTTVPISHATPAAFAAHNTRRQNYRAIADEMITETVPRLLIGAGHPHYVESAHFSSDADESYISEETYRALRDGSTDYRFVERTEGAVGADQLDAAVTDALDAREPLCGLYGGPTEFTESYRAVHAPGTPTFERTTDENPTLAEATRAALRFLSLGEERFFLLVEGGVVDWANHDNDYQLMLAAMHNFERAVAEAILFVDDSDEMSWDDTLFIVTSDHGNSYLKLNRGSNLGPGILPEQVDRPGGLCTNFDCGLFLYPNNEVAYAHGAHTNELVTLAAKGIGATLFDEYDDRYLDKSHPEPRIADNTDIYKVITRAMTQVEGARHVVLFLGDGMHESNEAAYSRYLHGTDEGLVWDRAGPPSMRFDYTGWTTTWDVTTYDRYGAQLDVARFTPDTFNPRVGYDPERGGWRPAVYIDQTTDRMDDYFLTPLPPF